MRLLNAKTFDLEEFVDSNVPGYAILSHTWSGDEITFAEVQSGFSDILSTRRGYQKIVFTTSEARKDGLKYAWVDSCCIDKSNSSELSEAINSMFNWYRNATICYTYLSDVNCEDIDDQLSGAPINISQSRWFTRGWTLQELIASRSIKFFDYPWTALGNKVDLMQTITEATHIPTEVLENVDAVFGCSVAQRMSWAAERSTTRIEDMAYCLLGIFAVNMPVLYGEGTVAFLRLQENIIKQIDDFSLFAWTRTEVQRVHVGSLFADSPRAFLGAGDLVSERRSSAGFCIMHQTTLMLPLPILPFGKHPNNEDTETTVAILPCRNYHEPNAYLGIPLMKPNSELPWKRLWGGNQGVIRVNLSQLDEFTVQTIEVDISTASIETSEDAGCLKYHGPTSWSNLIWGELIGDNQQKLWNTAIKKVMGDLLVSSDTSRSARIAVTISISDGQSGERGSIPHRSGTLWHRSPVQESTQHQDSDITEIALDPGSVTSRVAGENMQMENAFKPEDHGQQWRLSHGHYREGQCPNTTAWEAANENNISNKHSGDDLTWDLVVNPESGQSSSMADSVILESKRETNEREKRTFNAAEEGDWHNYASILRDIDSDDASSNMSVDSVDPGDGEDAFLLDVLVDVLVDIITERSDIPAALLRETKFNDIERCHGY
jgi:Heterokaryon incompatibility protein (HET)